MPNNEIYEVSQVDHRKPQCVNANSCVPGLALKRKRDCREQECGEAGNWENRVRSAGVHVEKVGCLRFTLLQRFNKLPSSILILGTQLEALGTV